jgi:hypothetical protein
MMTKSMLTCLSALTKQPLVKRGHGYEMQCWRHYRRRFSYQTVKALVMRGLAQRVGDRVFALTAANDN